MQPQEDLALPINTTASPVASAKNVLRYREIKPIINFLGYSQKEAAEMLGVSCGTLYKWEKNEKEVLLGRLQSKLMWEIDEVIAKGVKLFGSEENLKNWLNTPQLFFR